MKMNYLKLYDIKFTGLKNGNHTFTFHVSQEFFKQFNFEEFNDSDIDIVLELIKRDNLLEISIISEGFVNIPCDISGKNFDQPIKGNLSFIVKFGDEYNDDREDLMIIPYNSYKLNVAQQIYESVLLNVPAKRMHPDIISGKMHTEAEKYIVNYDNEASEQENKEEEIDPRWSVLKNILTEKNNKDGAS